MSSDGSPSGRTARPPRRRNSWAAVLSWSMLAAAVAHALVFALGPRWEVPLPVMRGGSGVALLQPLAAAQALADPAVGGLLRTPDGARPELADPDPHRAESDAAALAMLDLVAPSVVEPVPARSPADDLRLSPLVVQHRPVLHARVQSATPNGLWRDILNVEQVIQFLRASYNQVFETTGARGYAVIRVWVDAGGRVAHSEVHESSGEEALDRIALQLFDQVVRFERYERVGGSLTSAVISVPFEQRW